MNQKVPSPEQKAANAAYNERVIAAANGGVSRNGSTEDELRQHTREFLLGLSVFIAAGAVEYFCPERSSQKTQQENEIRRPATRLPENHQPTETITDDTDDQTPAPKVSMESNGENQQASTGMAGEEQVSIEQKPLESE